MLKYRPETETKLQQDEKASKLQYFRTNISLINKRELTGLTQIFDLVVEIFVMIYFLLAEKPPEKIRNYIMWEDDDCDYDDRWWL